jgi:hypothetical protein
MSHDPAQDPSLRVAAARKGSLVQTCKAVAWGFFGVRKASGYEQDIATINPVHVIVAGVVAAAALVAVLVALVRWIIQSGIAA